MCLSRWARAPQPCFCRSGGPPVRSVWGTAWRLLGVLAWRLRRAVAALGVLVPGRTSMQHGKTVFTVPGVQDSVRRRSKQPHTDPGVCRSPRAATADGRHGLRVGLVLARSLYRRGTHNNATAALPLGGL